MESEKDKDILIAVIEYILTDRNALEDFISWSDLDIDSLVGVERRLRNGRKQNAEKNKKES